MWTKFIANHAVFCYQQEVINNIQDRVALKSCSPQGLVLAHRDYISGLQNGT